MPLILPARTLDSGYTIDNSLRLNDDDNPRLSKTYGSEGNRKTFSISFWQKKAKINHDNDYIMAVQGSDDATNFEVSNHSSQAMQIGLYHVNMIRTNRLFRDPSAWYHVMFFIDTTQASESNRFKLYINGVQETSFSQSNIPSQNADVGWGRAAATRIGNSEGNTSAIDAYLSEFYYIDGQAKAPTDFGETNDNGVWIPKKYEGTYGSNGIFLEFQQTGTGTDASGMGADTSGNTNHFAVSNLTATDQTTDTPTNNFCTLNPLDSGTVTFAEGNCEITCANDQDDGARGSIGVQNGKWYFEFKLISHAGGNPPQALGVAQSNASVTNWISGNNYAVYEIDSGKKRINGSQSNYGATATDDDIIGVALNMDDNEVTFYKNGSSQGTITSATSSGEFYFPYIIDGSTARGHTTQVNFGNPPFAISSGNTDGLYGNFEYAPPSGYYALCTKRLATYG